MFRTYELSEEKLTPSLSNYKLGKVKSIDEKYVCITLLREYNENEYKIFEHYEFLEDRILEKYELTLERYLLIDLKVRKS